MRELSIERMEKLGGGAKPTKYDWIAGVSCGATLVMAFTPAAPLAILTGNVCSVSLVGYAIGKY
jgi:hypothetical protein